MVIINNKILKTLDGKSYKLPENIYFVLKEAVNRSKQKLDNVVCYTGGVGSGKSNLSKGVNGTYNEHFLLKPYTLDDVYFLIEKVLDSFDRKDNKGAPINYDEAVQGGSSKDGMSKLGKALRNAFITKRTKRHLISLCVDNPKELNDKIIERSIAWYHVFYTRTKKGKYVKGLFKVFSKIELRTVYDDLKKQKYRYVEQHPIFKKNTNIYKCYDYSEIFYSEDEYDNKKNVETSKDSQKEEKEDKHLIQRNKLINNLLDNGIKQQEIANITGLSRSTIRDIKGKMAAV